MSGDSTPLQIVCSLATEEILDLLHQRLDRHHVQFTVTSHSDHIHNKAVFSYGHEILDVIIADPLLFKALVWGAMAGGGFSLVRIFGKVLEAGATELGKDLYGWLKDGLATAIRKMQGPTAPQSNRLVSYISGRLPVGRTRMRVIVQLNYDPGHGAQQISVGTSEWESHLMETLQRVLGQLVPLAIAVVKNVRFPWKPEEICIEAEVLPSHEVRASLSIRWVAELRFNRTYELIEVYTDHDWPGLTEDIRRIYALFQPTEDKRGPKGSDGP